MSANTSLLTACAGFLLAVLWMDLMFDVQVRTGRPTGDELPDAVLDSIAGYYRRAVTESRPMSHLIPVVMVTLLGALAVRAAQGHDPAWLLALSIASAVGPILLVAVRTVPNAARLGSRSDTPGAQTALARSIFRDHLACLVAVSAFLALWLAHDWM
jgi:hypothetical protein